MTDVYIEVDCIILCCITLNELLGELFTFITVSKKPVICIGAALIDESFICLTEPIPATSNPSNFYRSPGGVACNIAHHLALLGHPVELISHFGTDPEGKWLMEECRKSGISITHSVVNHYDTGRYVAVLSPSGELFVGAMSGHFENEVTPDFLRTKTAVLKSATLLLLDCNLSIGSLEWLLDFSRSENIPCVIEPVSIPKAARLKNVNLNHVLLLTPNNDEMLTLTGHAEGLDSSALIQELLNRGVQYLWIRKGKSGSVIYSNEFHKEIPALPVAVTDITGAGDAAMAGWIDAWLARKNPEDCVRYGHAMASIVLQVQGAIDKSLNRSLLELTFKKYI